MEPITDKIMETARRQSLFRARDIREVRDPRSTLRRMVKRGELVQPGRGLYALPDGELSMSHTFVEATRRYSGGVICLVSALAFHGIGTQMPHETWMMRRDRKMPPIDALDRRKNQSGIVMKQTSTPSGKTARYMKRSE